MANAMYTAIVKASNKGAYTVCDPTNEPMVYMVRDGVEYDVQSLPKSLECVWQDDAPCNTPLRVVCDGDADVIRRHTYTFPKVSAPKLFSGMVHIELVSKNVGTREEPVFEAVIEDVYLRNKEGDKVDDAKIVQKARDAFVKLMEDDREDVFVRMCDQLVEGEKVVVFSNEW